MIRIITHIKRTLLRDGKFGKYAVYAIGEIFLIVVGILIAIQLEDWRQRSKNAKLEQAIITDLHEEFLVNKELLAEARGYLGEAMDSCYQLMALMNKDTAELEKHDVDLLLYWSMEYPAFHPSDNVFQEMMQTGRLGLLRDEVLKDTLFRWEREVENAKTDMQIFLKYKYEQYLPYLNANTTMKNIDRHSPMAWKELSKFPDEDHLIFHDKLFENLLDNLLFSMNGRDVEFASIEATINEVLERTKQP